MKAKLPLFILLLFLTTKNFASIKLDSLNQKHKRAFGINISTNGFGAQFSHTLVKSGQLTARLESRYYHKSIKNQESYLYSYNYSQDTYLVNGYIQKGSIGIMLDYHPFKNNWKITVGFASLLNKVENVAKLRDSVTQGSIKISPDEMGTLTYNYALSYSPYLGFGWGNVVPKKRFGFHIEMGVYYSKVPQISLKGTGLFEPINMVSHLLMPIDAASHYLLPILPVANLGLSILLGKIPN